MITSSGVPGRGFLNGSLLMQALYASMLEPIEEEGVVEDDEPES